MNSSHLAHEVHDYMLQPGDGTLYRFGWSKFPEDESAYTLASGVGGDSGTQDYIRFWIDMPGGTGIGVLPVWDLKTFPESTHVIGYLQGHGFQKVYIYTLIAVVMALKALIDSPENIDLACEYMRYTPTVLDEMEG